jgi:hypothetical protein
LELAALLTSYDFIAGLIARCWWLRPPGILPASLLFEEPLPDSQKENPVCGMLLVIVSRGTALGRESLRTGIYMSLMDADALDAGWRKASLSVNNGACVEVASARAAVMVRDSVDPSGPVVAYPAATWQAFLAAAKASN